MNTQTLIRNTLPESTLGRAGDGLFSSQKDLTVILISFERFSSFAKAVDDLYKTIDVPFDLIVIEGNAPQSVRASLEQRQRKYKNITIIYSTYQTSVGAAINLAVPHVKTPYAFILDNDVRVPRGAMKNLLQGAFENPYGVVCPQNYFVLSRGAYSQNRGEVQDPGSRTCLLVSSEAFQELGKLDESMTPFTTGIDIRMRAAQAGVPVYNEISTRIELLSESYLWPMDAALHSFQWDETRAFESLEGLERKWGIRLKKMDCAGCIRHKKQNLLESRNPFHFLSGMLPRFRFPALEKSPKKNLRNVLLPAAA